MTRTEAARVQYRLHSFYTVQLVTPTGEKEIVGSTQRKSGSGLLHFVCGSDALKAKLSAIPGMLDGTFKKTAKAIVFSNGYKIEFGGTIRQEAE